MMVGVMALVETICSSGGFSKFVTASLIVTVTAEGCTDLISMPRSGMSTSGTME